MSKLEQKVREAIQRIRTMPVEDFERALTERGYTPTRKPEYSELSPSWVVDLTERPTSIESKIVHANMEQNIFSVSHLCSNDNCFDLAA